MPPGVCWSAASRRDLSASGQRWRGADDAGHGLTTRQINRNHNGPTPVNMDLRYGTALDATRLVNVAPEASSSNGVVRVRPGNHAASNLWQRVQATGSERMPPLGVAVVDAEAVQLLSTWIDGLQ
jgi:hypothetical protein